MADHQLKPVTPHQTPGADPQEQSLARFLLEEWPSLGLAEKCRLLRGFASFLRQAHDQGVRHRRLNLEAVSIDPSFSGGRFGFPGSAAGLQGRGPLGFSMRVGELASLLASLLPHACRSEGVRFLKAYLGEAPKAERRRWLEAVYGGGVRLAAARWRRQDRLTLASNRQFQMERKGNFAVYRQRGDAAEEALAALLPDPDRLLADGEVLFGRGNSCLAAKVRIAGRLYLLKRYNCRGPVYRLRHLVRRSRALRTWFAAWAFRRRGVAVPEPCLCLEERRWGLLGRAYILTEYFDGAETLSDLYPTLPPAGRRDLLAHLGKVFGTLHRYRGIHGDTNWDNILVRTSGREFSITLVDLDGSRILSRPRPQRAAKDIWHFVRDMKRRGGDSPQEIDFFLRCWSRWAGFRGRLPF